MRLIALVLLAAPSLARADGCDLDTPTGVKCGSWAIRAEELTDLLGAVGSVKELRTRVMKAGATGVTVFAGAGPRGTEVVFDARGRFVSWNGTRTFAWDDSDRLVQSRSNTGNNTLAGSATQCVLGSPDPKPFTATCTIVGKTLQVQQMAEKAQQFTLVDDGWKGSDGKYDLRRDKAGRVVRDDEAVTYTFSPTSTTATFQVLTEDGAETNEKTWTLNADGLPTELRTPYTVKRFEWTKRVRVRVIDGTCPPKKACPNPALEQLAAALTAVGRYTVDRAEPPNKQRTATELWYQPGYKAHAEQVRADVLKDKVLPENVKEWMWGGPFDVLVIVGP